MSLTLLIPEETHPGENRVALDPSQADRFQKLGLTVVVAPGAGNKATFTDELYAEKISVQNLPFSEADIIFKVQPPTVEEAQQFKEGSTYVGFVSPHRNLDVVRIFQERNITSLAMELVPRISRAQSMDALSSQAMIAGYKGVLNAADLSPWLFPMFTTAAGTIRPAKIVVIGAGVAGLQAIATARRLGAIVEAYDIRAAAKEQVESLGAKLIDTGVDASGEGGYARELTQEEKDKQAQVLAQRLAQANAVITTAAIPGRDSPKIITREMVENMIHGAVIVDLAADGGGNCELSEPGKTIVHQGVTIHAPLIVASGIPAHASEMYAKNLYNLVSPFVKDGQLVLDWEDDVIAGCGLTHNGEVRHEPTRNALNSMS